MPESVSILTKVQGLNTPSTMKVSTPVIFTLISSSLFLQAGQLMIYRLLLRLVKSRRIHNDEYQV